MQSEQDDSYNPLLGKVGILFGARSLWHKRLEREKLHWPETEKEVMEVTCQQLAWLLDGLDISQVHEHLEYSVMGCRKGLGNISEWF